MLLISALNCIKQSRNMFKIISKWSKKWENDAMRQKRRKPFITNTCLLKSRADIKQLLSWAWPWMCWCFNRPPRATQHMVYEMSNKHMTQGRKPTPGCSYLILTSYYWQSMGGIFLLDVLWTDLVNNISVLGVWLLADVKVLDLAHVRKCSRTCLTSSLLPTPGCSSEIKSSLFHQEGFQGVSHRNTKAFWFVFCCFLIFLMIIYYAFSGWCHY